MNIIIEASPEESSLLRLALDAVRDLAVESGTAIVTCRQHPQLAEANEIIKDLQNRFARHDGCSRYGTTDMAVLHRAGEYIRKNIKP